MKLPLDEDYMTPWEYADSYEGDEERAMELADALYDRWKDEQMEDK
jgi:hypothetical protein